MARYIYRNYVHKNIGEMLHSARELANIFKCSPSELVDMAKSVKVWDSCRPPRPYTECEYDIKSAIKIREYQLNKLKISLLDDIELSWLKKRLVREESDMVANGL